MILLEQADQELLSSVQDANARIENYKYTKDTEAGVPYWEKVKQDKDKVELEYNWNVCQKIKIAVNVENLTPEKYDFVKQSLRWYQHFLQEITSEETFKTVFKPKFKEIEENMEKAKERFSALSVSLSAASNLTQSLDSIQGIVEFYRDPNNKEALRKLQKNDKKATIAIYNAGKDLLKNAGEINKSNLTRVQKIYADYLQLIGYTPSSYDVYFEPLVEKIAKAIIEKEDALTPTTPTPSATTPTTKTPPTGGTPKTPTKPGTPSAAIPPGLVKPIGVTGTGAGAGPVKRDYKTLLGTDNNGNSLYFVRTGPGNYRPAVKADKDAGVQIFARNPNPVARTIYPFIKIQNMPTRRASPV